MKQDVHVLLHDIRSMHNVGSIFRTADAAGISKIYLTGYTATPPRKEITKTALGADEFVIWEYHADPLALIQALKKQGMEIVALERTKESQNIQAFKAEKPICLIVGNEIDGVGEAMLKKADAILEIPMNGKKESLNVSVAFGIAAYALST